MPRWLCNSLVLTSVTKLKKRNEIIQSWIFFTKKTNFQLEIFVSTAHCFARQNLSVAAFSVGAVTDHPIFFSVMVSPAPGNRKKHHETASLTFKHKKRGAGEADGSSVGWENSPIFLVGGFLVVFGWGPGGQERCLVVFQDDTVIPGWVITTMGVEAWCFSQQT